MKLKMVILLASIAALTGCLATTEQMQANKANDAEWAKIRIVPESMVSSCSFLNQENVVQGQSFFGGSKALGSDSEKALKKKAYQQGANTIHVTDRIYDDGAGGKKQPTMTIYGNLYKC